MCRAGATCVDTKAAAKGLQTSSPNAKNMAHVSYQSAASLLLSERYGRCHLVFSRFIPATSPLGPTQTATRNSELGMSHLLGLGSFRSLHTKFVSFHVQGVPCGKGTNCGSLQLWKAFVRRGVSLNGAPKSNFSINAVFRNRPNSAALKASSFARHTHMCSCLRRPAALVVAGHARRAGDQHNQIAETSYGSCSATKPTTMTTPTAAPSVLAGPRQTAIGKSQLGTSLLLGLGSCRSCRNPKCEISRTGRPMRKWIIFRSFPLWKTLVRRGVSLAGTPNRISVLTLYVEIDQLRELLQSFSCC